MRGDTVRQPAVKGEWECDGCGYVLAGQENMPPRKPCPECGEPADNSFTFFPYEDGWDDGWDDDEDSEE
jgi:rubrerythrin